MAGSNRDLQRRDQIATGPSCQVADDRGFEVDGRDHNGSLYPWTPGGSESSRPHPQNAPLANVQAYARLYAVRRHHLRDDIRPVTEFRRLLEELELRRDIHAAESQLAEGQGVSHDAARATVLAAFRP